MGSKSNGSKLIFKRNVEKDMGETSMTPQMLNVMMAVDGRKTLAEINAETKLPAQEFKEALNKLYKLKLILPAEKSEMRCLERDFFVTMNKLLADSVGPISATLIGDIVKDMGFRPEEFPAGFGNELIQKVSENVFDAEKKEQFIAVLKEKL